MFRGITTLATELDHIIPIKLGGDWFDAGNLQPLCSLCHQFKTAAEAAQAQGKHMAVRPCKHGFPINKIHMCEDCNGTPDAG